MVRSTLYQQQQTRPDPIRIVAIAASIAINAAMLAVLMQPPQFTAPVAPGTDIPPVVFVVPAPKRIELPPPIEVKHEVQKQQQRPVITPISRPVVPPVVTHDATPMSTEFIPQATDTHQVETVLAPPQPQISSLNTIAAPAPIYPRNALRDGITGTVKLELLVGVDGRVLEVHVVSGSGNRELDAAAREQVLRYWRFQPAMRDGVAIQARGIVPIVFSLDGR